MIFSQESARIASTQLNARLKDLSLVQAGWLEGFGVALDQEKLLIVKDRFLEFYPQTLLPPLISPTPEGNLLFEWNTAVDASVDLELKTLQAQFHAFSKTGGDIEKTFVLTTPKMWQEFFWFLEQTIKD